MKKPKPTYDEDGFEIEEDDEGPCGAVFLTPMLSHVYRNLLGSTASDPEFCRWVAESWKQYIEERVTFDHNLIRCWQDLPEHPPIKDATEADVKRLRAFFKPVSQSSHHHRSLLKFDLECMRVRRLLYGETWPTTRKQLDQKFNFATKTNHEAYLRYERLRSWLRYHQDAEESALKKRKQYYSISKDERQIKERVRKAVYRAKKKGVPPPLYRSHSS